MPSTPPPAPPTAPLPPLPPRQEEEAWRRPLVHPLKTDQIWSRVAAAVLKAELDFKGSCACPLTRRDGLQPGDIDVLYTGTLKEAITAMTSALTEAALEVVKSWEKYKDKIYCLDVVCPLRRHETFVIELISPTLHKNAPQLTDLQSFLVSGGATPSLQVMLPAGRAGDIKGEVAAIVEDVTRRTFRLFRKPSSLGDARSLLKLVEQKHYSPADAEAHSHVVWARGRVALADSEIDADVFFTCSRVAPEAVRVLVWRVQQRYEALGDADKRRARGLLAGFGEACTMEGALSRFSDKQLEAPQIWKPILSAECPARCESPRYRRCSRSSRHSTTSTTIAASRSPSSTSWSG